MTKLIATAYRQIADIRLDQKCDEFDAALKRMGSRIDRAPSQLLSIFVSGAGPFWLPVSLVG